MNTAAFIFARGGSKGLPRKNIRQFAGKPLIAWSIEQALAIEQIGSVIVSTDSEEIASVARDYGATVPFMRPAELSADDTPEWLVWQHALGYLLERDGVLPDAMVSLPSTSPLRLVVDVQRCLDLFEEGDSDMIVTITDAHRSPYFNMVEQKSDGLIGLVVPPISSVTRRQDAKVVFDMTTVAYVARPKFVIDSRSMFEGKVRAVLIPADRAIDIDTLLDFEIAEFLFVKRMAVEDVGST
jgi:N-acylneuraminate cytidylyltransferase